MGAMQNNNDKGTKKKGKRGSVRNADRLDVFARSSPTSGADWGGCDPKWIQAVITSITELGGAVTFGMSRDRGAHSVSLLLDDKRTTLWFNGDANLDEELEGVAATLEAITD